jgi:hypothetical protein
MTTKKFKYKIQLYFTLISLVIVDCFRWLSYQGFLNVGFSTYIALVLIYCSICIFIKIALTSGWRENAPTIIRKLIKLWICLNVLVFSISIFLANDYWDYKYLIFNAITFVLISFVFFIGNDEQLTAIVLKFVFKYLFPFGFFLVPVTFATNPELYSRIMIPISLFILFIPYIKWRYKLLIIIIALTSSLIEINFRSNLIKISFSIMLLLIYYLNLNFRFLRIINVTLLVGPLVLLVLSVTGQFSILTEIAENSDFQIETTSNPGETFADDSRTFLYVEVLQSIMNDGNFFFGSGYTKGYNSVLIEVTDGSARKNKRYDCEVGILNFLMQVGLLGIIIYFILFYKVTFLAINHSSNGLAKILGLYISFRWLLSFIEEFTQYDLNFYFFWLAMGLVSSNRFRAMNDREVIKWFESIFQKNRTTITANVI